MYLFLHVRTGGPDPVEHSLLTAHFALVDPGSLKVLKELSVSVRPSNAYKVTAGTLMVNNIDLTEHWQASEPAWEAAGRIQAFLDDRFRRQPLVPVGWNVGIDVNFVRQQLLYDWDNLVSYRSIDLQAVVRFLVDAGVCPPKVDGWVSAAEFFGLDTTGYLDVARTTRLLVEVFRAVRALVKEGIGSEIGLTMAWHEEVASAKELEFGPQHFRDQALLALRLVEEESTELLEELRRVADYSYLVDVPSELRAAAAKEAADTLFVVIQAMHALDIPFAEVFREVLASNRSKIAGGATFRDDGKLLKGSSYRPADVDSVLARHRGYR